MNTESQKVVEISTAHVQDSGSVEYVGTRKVFVKRFDNVGPFAGSRWAEMIEWCRNNLYHGGHYEPYWSAIYPSFYFTDEKEYTLFLLRWT